MGVGMVRVRVSLVMGSAIVPLDEVEERALRHLGVSWNASRYSGNPCPCKGC